MPTAPTAALPKPESAVSPRPAGARRRWLALPVLMLPVVLISVDATVLSFALPELSRQLRPSGTQLLWIVDVYAFVLAGLLIPMGGLGDRIGRRRLLVAGLALFGLASVAAAWATSPVVLIAARAALGVGGATLMPSTLSLLRTVFTDARERRIAVASWSAAWAGGAALGPVLGGWLLEHYWWGSVFLINVPIVALALVLGRTTLPESRDPAAGRIDLPSVGLVMACTLSLAQAIKSLAGGHDAPGGAGPALGLVAVSLAAGVLFVRRQRRIAHPLVDLTMFADPRFSGALGVNFVSVLGWAGATFFIAQYLQLVLGLGPLDAAVLLLPGLAAVVVTSYGAVRLARRFSVSGLVVAGLVVEVCGYALGTLLGEGGRGMLLATMFLLVGAGAGLAETLTADVILSSVPAQRAGSASAISETGYELGSAMGTAVFGSLLTAWYARSMDGALHGLPGLTDAARGAAEQTLGGAMAVAAGLPGDASGTLVSVARAAFTAGAHVTSLAGAALLGLGALAVVVHRRRR